MHVSIVSAGLSLKCQKVLCYTVYGVTDSCYSYNKALDY